jgi:nitroimidazol reductase NimA-like FMN-containing flavoprotein (pyridoxamine 5'-phosphate oxidase superfamily)
MDNARRESRIEELSTEECYQRLAARSLGRVGVIVGRYPLIIPVNDVLDRDAVVIRTAPRTVIADADHTKVTLQVDDVDVVDRSGWSVLLKGCGRQVHPTPTDSTREPPPPA